MTVLSVAGVGPGGPAGALGPVLQPDSEVSLNVIAKRVLGLPDSK